MDKSDTGKPEKSPVIEVLDCGSLAYKYLQGYDSALQAKPSAVDIEDFVMNYLQLNVLNGSISLPYIKGYIVYTQMLCKFNDYHFSVNPGTIILNRELKNNLMEWRFVLAHEAGHWIIRRERPTTIQSNYACCKSFSERTDIFDTERIKHYFDHDPDAWSETRADSVANALLMPANAFLMLASELMEQHGISEHKIFVGECPDAESKIIQDLASTFVVPEYAVKNRLYTFGMYEKSNRA